MWFREHERRRNRKALGPVTSTVEIAAPTLASDIHAATKPRKRYRRIPSGAVILQPHELNTSKRPGKKFRVAGLPEPAHDRTVESRA